LLSKPEELAVRESVSQDLFKAATNIARQVTDDSAGKPLAAASEDLKSGGYRKYLSTLFGAQNSGNQGCHLFLANYLRHTEPLSIEQAREKVKDMHQEVMAAVPLNPTEERDPIRIPAFTPIDNQTTTAELLQED